MKKFFLFITISSLFVFCANAQLAVQSDGKIKIGTTTPSTAQINIRASRTNILACRTGTASGIAPVLEGVCLIQSPQWAMGVRGSAEGGNGAINCGLWGSAASSTSNKIYGVFGSIDANNGAAIYGQAYSWTNSSSAALTAPYAGYFDGNVYVQGILSCTGSMLTAMPSPSEIQVESVSTRTGDSFTTSSQLQSLEVQRYIHTTPLPSHKRSTISDEDLAGLDSLEIEAIKRNRAELGEESDVIAKQSHAKQHYSLNVEQLEAAFPDLVYENENGTICINYVEMVPILVQAIKELKAEIDELKGGNSDMR